MPAKAGTVSGRRQTEGFVVENDCVTHARRGGKLVEWLHSSSSPHIRAEKSFTGDPGPSVVPGRQIEPTGFEAASKSISD